MTRTLFFAPLIAAGFSLVFGVSASAAEPAPVQSIRTPAVYSTANTDIGTLLDNPAAKAILDRHVPQFTANEQIEMARAMTLRQIQSYASDMLTDEVLARIDADFARLPARK